MKNELSKIISGILFFIFTFYVVIDGSLIFDLFLISIMLFTIYEWCKLKNKLIILLSGIIFIFLSFYCAYQLRTFHELGLYFFGYVLIITICTDIGGFIFGKILKGPKINKISPNKTYSGSIGGYFLSLLTVLFYLILLFENNIILFDNNYLVILTITLFISTVSQFGDFVISFFKRKSNIKNTGNLLPGHGGLLDRIDGLIFALPIFYLILFFHI